MRIVHTLDPTQGNVVDPNIPTLVSSTVIAPTSIVTRVTGNTAVATITPPNPYFNGPLYLYSTEASPFTINTTGNVALAVTATRYKLLTLFYDPSVSKWMPSFAS